MGIRPCYPCYNGLAPSGDYGPVAIPVTFDFSLGVTPITGDLLQEETEGVADHLQSIYIDNSANGSSFTIQFFPSQQKIVIGANKQGTFPIICGGPLKFSGSSAGNVAVPCLLLNVPLPVGEWN